MVQGRSVQVEDSRGGEYRASFSMEAYLRNCIAEFYLFIWRSVWMIAILFSLLKSPTYQNRVKCVVVDEAHLIKEW